ncbi:MAG: N-formylglutamate amidohydrolase [Rhizobiaceae bacterium]
MGGARPASAGSEAVRVTNEAGLSPYVIVCDHASNFIPPQLGTLGLPDEALLRHIAWDPGALGVSEGLSAHLDAALVQSCVSRLVIDCNRPLEAHDLIAETSETTGIPGNRALTHAQRAERIRLSYDPFHAAVAGVVDRRLHAGRETRLVSIHSFTPVYRGIARPWQVGVIHDDDRRIADPLIAALEALGDLEVGRNEPYSPADRVYFTLTRHARSRGLPCAMVEIRNDQIAVAERQAEWARLLGVALSGIGISWDDTRSRPGNGSVHRAGTAG